MNFQAIQHVFRRELRDQLRDRRTLFTVLILPVLIYPLLGVAMLQISQLSTSESCRVWLIGAERLPGEVPLVEGGLFGEGLLPELERLLTAVESLSVDDRSTDRKTVFPDFALRDSERDERLNWIRREMILRRFDLAIVVTPATSEEESNAGSVPHVQIIQNSSSDSSLAAADRAKQAIQKWSQRLVAQKLDEHQLKFADLKPLTIAVADLADPAAVSAVKWSKTLPLILVIWALTGAFYPAVDLCAGEKERGTLETLLSSPAPRSAVIGGKLLTVMTFSFVTAVLNLISLGISAGLVMGMSSDPSSLGQKFGMTLPPLHVFPILVVALIPIAALFSSLAFSVAAFARSTKEGQYYLMPLLMFTFPLLMLPMMPGTQLELGTSLIPVSGLMLLLHALIEQEYFRAALFAVPVAIVTTICGVLALKWSSHQFHDESILFRAADRISLLGWLRHLLGRRANGPTWSQALSCAAVILIVKFFSMFVSPMPHDWASFARQTFGLLGIAVAVPAIAFALTTSRRPWTHLGLRIPRLWAILLPALMAVFLHPVFAFLGDAVTAIFPLRGTAETIQNQMATVIDGAPGILALLLVLAIAPAICEELAFRGYILTGLRSSLTSVPAVLISSALFGLAHSIIQQSIVTFFVGIVLGVWAIRTRSVWPCIAFHSVHNSLTVLLSQIQPNAVAGSSWLQQIIAVQAGEVVGYRPFAAVLGGFVAMLLGLILFRQSIDAALAPWRLPLRQTSPSAAP